jgi:hypothetical protein
LTLIQFRDRFPEFATAADALVTACLTAAAGETSATALGTAYDEAHGLLAAHKLAISPFGGMARLEAGKETTYQQERRALLERVIVPFDVAAWPQVTA